MEIPLHQQAQSRPARAVSKTLTRKHAPKAIGVPSGVHTYEGSCDLVPIVGTPNWNLPYAYSETPDSASRFTGNRRLQTPRVRALPSSPATCFLGSWVVNNIPGALIAHSLMVFNALIRGSDLLNCR